MPVSVLFRLSIALFAAGVLTEGDGDERAVFELAGFEPKLFPVVPWFSALDVLGPGDPPVPLIVLPFDNVFPLEPPAPLALEAPLAPPPELCPSAKEKLPSSTLRTIANAFMAFLLFEEHQW
jgi:hypothetical protein